MIINLDISTNEKGILEYEILELGFISLSEYVTACMQILLSPEEKITPFEWSNKLRRLRIRKNKDKEIFFSVITEYAFDEIAEKGTGYVRTMMIEALNAEYRRRGGKFLDKTELVKLIKIYRNIHFADLAKRRYEIISEVVNDN